MVHLKSSSGQKFSTKRRKMAPVKREIVDDALPDEYRHLRQRSKPSSALSNDFGSDEFPIASTQYKYNPLDEPSPLGLRLRKSPSLLELIQMKLTQGNVNKIGLLVKEEQKVAASEKLKASNFVGSLLRIGSWEYKSRYEGDLVAKCYFAKHKLVWEVLDGGLKNKIEIQWSDILSLKGDYPDDGPGTLDIVLAKQPLFFRETNPQPRKHTLWQATIDFTGGQATKHRKHFLECPQGLLGRHFEKLIQCDPRLNFLSRQKEIVLESPCFEPIISVFDDSSKEDKENPKVVHVTHVGSQSLLVHQTSHAKEEHNSSSRLVDDGPSHSSSVMINHALEEFKGNKAEELKALFKQDHFRKLGLNPSMSMNDLVSHIENQISGKSSSGEEEKQSLEILEEISQSLFSNFQCSSASEQSIMARVNSLYCLMQKDPSIQQQDNDNKHMHSSDSVKTTNEQNMSRKDSAGELLLLNLPRIASLPQFLFNIPDDHDCNRNQTR